jgi:hypothetical protein
VAIITKKSILELGFRIQLQAKPKWGLRELVVEERLVYQFALPTPKALAPQVILL